jgi:hypothetical protein
MTAAQVQKFIEARNERYGRGFSGLDIGQVSACLTDDGLVFNDVGRQSPAKDLPLYLD